MCEIVKVIDNRRLKLYIRWTTSMIRTSKISLNISNLFCSKLKLNSELPS